MSLLGFDDGAGSSTGNGYLDIVDFILRGCTDVRQNLRELYRRVAFNIMYGNTDDYFCNHGFLLTPKLAGHSLLHTTSILESKVTSILAHRLIHRRIGYQCSTLCKRELHACPQEESEIIEDVHAASETGAKPLLNYKYPSNY